MGVAEEPEGEILDFSLVCNSSASRAAANDCFATSEA